MTKIEFLEKLRTALSSDVPSGELQENLNYYSQYIDEEMRKGRTEQDVMDELGDPWLLARTIIDAKGGQGQSQTVYDADGDSYAGYGGQRDVRSRTDVWTFDTWWKKLLLVLVIVGVILLVFAVISGIISLVAPVLIPVLLVVFLVRLLRGRR